MPCLTQLLVSSISAIIIAVALRFASLLSALPLGPLGLIQAHRSLALTTFWPRTQGEAEAQTREATNAACPVPLSSSPILLLTKAEGCSEADALNPKSSTCFRLQGEAEAQAREALPPFTLPYSHTQSLPPSLSHSVPP